jgi:tetratricopeptide (TPR) repeat protein
LSEKPSTARHALAIYLGLALLCLLVYGPVFGHDFVNYDDPGYVTRNPTVQAGLTASGLGWAMTTNQMANWHPVTWLSHMLDCELFGLEPAWHHAHSLLLHVLNTLLLFRLLRRLTGDAWRSGLVAALFAAHPLHVESVAWVAERKDVLSSLFWLLATTAYVWYAERPGVSRYLPVAVLLALGLMAKPMLVTLPFTLLLLDLWPLQRIAPGRLDRGRRLGGLLLEKLPLFVIVAISAAVTVAAQSRSGAVYDLEQLPLGLRLSNAAVAYVRYLFLTFWPGDLSVFHPHLGVAIPTWQALSAMTALLGISAIAAASIGTRPPLFVGWFWYVGTLVPVIGLVQVGRQALAERYTYIPLVGLFLVVAWSVPGSWLESRRRRTALALVATAAVLALAFVAWRQVQVWRNSETLFRSALSATRENYLAHYNLAHALFERGDLASAADHFERAVAIWPDYRDAHESLGLVLTELDDYERALEHYRVALALTPDEPRLLSNLANTLARAGHDREAVRYYERALELEPDRANAHYNLAVVLSRVGRTEEARAHLARALELDPNLRTRRR